MEERRERERERERERDVDLGEQFIPQVQGVPFIIDEFTVGTEVRLLGLNCLLLAEKSRPRICASFMNK